MLAEFAFRAGPILWRRMSEDRRRAVKPAPRVPSFAEWSRQGVHAAWIGHSTVLIRVDGFTILTDPVFSTRIGIGIGPFTIGYEATDPSGGQPIKASDPGSHPALTCAHGSSRPAKHAEVGESRDHRRHGDWHQRSSASETLSIGS